MSTATVSKFLKELENDGEIQKKVDIDSGKYPYPAFYRLTAKGLERVKKVFLRDGLMKLLWSIILFLISCDKI